MKYKVRFVPFQAKNKYAMRSQNFMRFEFCLLMVLGKNLNLEIELVLLVL